jgi:hypothetical protein
MNSWAVFTNGTLRGAGSPPRGRAQSKLSEKQKLSSKRRSLSAKLQVLPSGEGKNSTPLLEMRLLDKGGFRLCGGETPKWINYELANAPPDIEEEKVTNREDGAD